LILGVAEPRLTKETPMLVRTWMSPDPVTVQPTTTANEARRLLRYYGIRHLPVVDDGQVVGMVSDRDVRVDEVLLAQLKAKPGGESQLPEALGETRLVEAVMSAPAHVIAPDEPIEAAARLMLSRQISALPVLDVDGGLLGVVTTTDCLLAFLDREPVLD
jgi:acetoin utilization protein AcuB